MLCGVGFVQAKTGTLDGVDCLSGARCCLIVLIVLCCVMVAGYVTQNGEFPPVVFSLMRYARVVFHSELIPLLCSNNSTASHAIVRGILDSIAVCLARLRPC